MEDGLRIRIVVHRLVTSWLTWMADCGIMKIQARSVERWLAPRMWRMLTHVSRLDGHKIGLSPADLPFSCSVLNQSLYYSPGTRTVI